MHGQEGLYWYQEAASTSSSRHSRDSNRNFNDTTGASHAFFSLRHARPPQREPTAVMKTDTASTSDSTCAPNLCLYLSPSSTRISVYLAETRDLESLGR